MNRRVHLNAGHRGSRNGRETALAPSPDDEQMTWRILHHGGLEPTRRPAGYQIFTATTDAGGKQWQKNASNRVGAYHESGILLRAPGHQVSPSNSPGKHG